MSSPDWSAQISLAVLLLLPVLVTIITKRRRANRNRRHLPPSPPELPLIGNLHLLGSIPHQSLRDLSQVHGPIMLLKLGQVPTLIVSSASTAEEIMKTHDHIFASRPSVIAIRLLLNGSMDIAFAPYGDYWRQLRKICVINLLSPKMVQSFRHVREQEVASLVSKISEACSRLGGAVDLTQLLKLFATNIMCKAIAGKSFGNGRGEVMCRLAEENIKILGRFSIGDNIPMLRWLDVVSGLEGRARRNCKGWTKVFQEIVEDHRKRSPSDSEEKRGVDFVHLLLALQEKNDLDFPVDQGVITAILMDMIAAGIDTTFITLDWCMAELIRKPQKLKTLQDEVGSIVKAERMLREEDLTTMIYLKSVIKETFRLHPAAPLLIPRESMEDCRIQGYDVPRKTRVIVNAWSIGRDPKSWKMPEEFQPERYIDSPIDYRGFDFELIPFGAGRRICPGMQFSVASLELALANLVHRFDWKLPDGIESRDLDMSDSPGLTCRRKQSLQLVAGKR